MSLAVTEQQRAIRDAVRQWAAASSPWAYAAAEPVYQFLLTRCLTIAGGTTQILLTLVGERLLGLPRESAG